MLKIVVFNSKKLFFFQYGTKALDKVTKAILGHIENKVPPPKGYPGGDARFFQGTLKLSFHFMSSLF